MFWMYSQYNSFQLVKTDLSGAVVVNKLLLLDSVNG